MQKLSDELVTARMQREAAEAQLAAAVNANGSGGSTVMEADADEAIAADPGLSASENFIDQPKSRIAARDERSAAGSP